MGNGKSKEGKGGLLAVSRNSIDEPPPTKSNSSMRTANRVNIYVDDPVVSSPNNNNITTNNNNNNLNDAIADNNSLHQSQLSNDSSTTNTNNNTITTNTATSSVANTPNNNNIQNTATTITSNTNTDSTTSSSSPNASTNNSILVNNNTTNLQLNGFGAASTGGSSSVFGVDVSVAVQRSCKLILKLLLNKKQQQEAGNVNQGVVAEESPTVEEEKKNEYKHPLASDEEIQAIEKVCANLETLFIPEVIRQCLRFLNSYPSLLEQGVYRIPGDTQKMKEYKEVFERGQSIDFLAENREIDRKRKEAQDNGVIVDIVHHGIKHDAHDVAGLIKLFLRELPGDYHLFTPQTAPEFSISHLRNFTTEEEKVESVRTSLLRVPRSNRDTLRALCEHFRLIIKYEKSNKMTTDNLLKCICGTSPYVLAFYFMVQYFDVVFKEEKKESSKPLTDEDMNSTKNIEWLLRAQNDNNVLSLGNLSHLAGGNNNLSNEVLAGKAMSARESRRKSYYQRQQRHDSTSEDTPTTATDQSDFASPSTIDNANSDNLDPITLALLKMKKDKDTQNDNTIATSNVDSQEQNDSSIAVEI